MIKIKVYNRNLFELVPAIRCLGNFLDQKFFSYEEWMESPLNSLKRVLIDSVSEELVLRSTENER